MQAARDRLMALQLLLTGVGVRLLGAFAVIALLWLGFWWATGGIGPL